MGRHRLVTRFPDVPTDGDGPLEWGVLAVVVAGVVYAISFVSGIDPAMILAVLVGVGWLAVVFQIVVWTLEGSRDDRERGEALRRQTRTEAAEAEDTASTRGESESGTADSGSTDGGTEASAETDAN